MVGKSDIADCSNRVKELDLAKTFTIIVSMIGIHVLYHLADYQVISSVTVNILNVLATAWGAPIFMFCMGITLGFSRHRNPSDRLRRGLQLLTIGMLFNALRWGPYAYTAHATGNPELMKGVAMVFNVDILQFAGLAFMLLALCTRLKISAGPMLVLSVIMNVAGTILTAADVFTSSYALNQVLGFFYHTPTCSCFPLMNWFIFVAAGNVMGQLYRNHNIDHLFRYILPISGVIAVVHQYLSITGQVPFFKTLVNDWEYYNMATPDALCIAFGVAPFMIGVFRMVGKVVPDAWMKMLGHPSRYILQYFCISWVLVMWCYCFLFFITPAVTMAAFVVRYLIVIALTIGIVLVYNTYLVRLIEPLFSRHTTTWIVGIWTAIVVLGIWFFTTIPEPYLMPY